MALSIHRIWYLFKMQWVENRKLYALGLLALIGIMALFLFTGSERPSDQSAFFVIGLFLSSAIFTSTILSRFSEKRKAMSALMLPASASEKTIVAIIYSMILFPLVYIALIYPVMIAAHYFHSEIQGDLAPLWDYRTADNTRTFIMLYLILQAFVLFCSAMFTRLTFIKTAVLVCIIMFGTVWLSEKINYQFYNTHHLQPSVLPKGFIADPPIYVTQMETKIIYPPKGSKEAPKTITSPLKPLKKIIIPAGNFNASGNGPFMEEQFNTTANAHNPQVWKVTLPIWQQAIFNILFYIVIPFFWLLTWLRLKEKTLI